MYDVIIIGRGPAGLSAALYTVRAGLKTLIAASAGGALEKAGKIDNYFGFGETVSGSHLISSTQEQVKRLGGEFLDTEIVDIQPSLDGGYTLKSSNGQELTSKALLIATGKSRAMPPIKGLADYEGAGVSHCAVCDGFFYRGKVVGVLGEGRFALAEAKELKPLVKSVTVFTNGKAPAFTAEESGNIAVDTRKITGVSGDGKLEHLLFGAESATLDGLFIALGEAGSSAFAAKLGIVLDKNSIVTDSHGATNIPGIYAAGDCTGGPYQISVSVGAGAKAGLAIAEYLRQSK